MDIGPAPGVPAVVSAETPRGAQTPQPPAYLLRDPNASDHAPVGQTQIAPPEADGHANAPDPSTQSPMPAVMALVEAGAPQDAPENLPLIVEALLFSAEEPPTVSQIAQATNVSRDAIEEALDELDAAAADRGLRLQRSGNTVRLVTAAEATPYIRRLLGLERPNKLSKAALETLAIVAYQQPVTRGAIERVRGVTCDAPIATLRLRELIAAVGRSDAPGHPNLWATTPAFLDHFSLHALTELPPLPGLPPPVEQGTLTLEAASDPASLDEEPPVNMGPTDAGPADVEPVESDSPEPDADVAPRHAHAGTPQAPLALAASSGIGTPPQHALGGLAAAGGD